MKKKLVIITPHLSTGGAPQFTLNKIELLKDEYEITCIEYSFMSPDFVVQRNRIMDVVDNFISLTENKIILHDIIESIKPDIISMEEFPENFMDDKVSKKIYVKDRNYMIVESTHSSINNFGKKRWYPDKFIFVSNFSAKMYGDLGVDFTIIEYPIDKKIKSTKISQDTLGLDRNYKHVLNVGLFTSGKNQGYLFEIARKLERFNIKFHFVGNQAGNFINYWEPLMKNVPNNCHIWGERSDVDDFMKASDLFFFPSKFELNPLVIKEAIMYDLPIMMFNLETYGDTYMNDDNIEFLSGDLYTDSQKLLSMLQLEDNFKFNNRDQLPDFLNYLGLTNKGVELGSFKGQYANKILNNWNGQLYMVDVWRALSDEEYDDASNNKIHSDAYAIAMDNIKGFEDRAFMLRMKGEYAANLFEKESLDFVYIDANHTYEAVRDDINIWYDKIKKDGLICGHDYLPKDMYKSGNKNIPLYLFPTNEPEKKEYAGMFGVNAAVDEFAEENNYIVNCTDEFLGTWWLSKKKTIKIVFYSDKKYEYQAKTLIESIILNIKDDVEMIYYTIGFNSDLNYDNLIKRFYPIDEKKPQFEYYKPAILLNAIDEFGRGDFLFLDTDIIIGRRFDFRKIKNNNDYPILSVGNWDYPFRGKFLNGEWTDKVDETNLMKYFGVESRSMNYVYTCIISFNEKCRDFIVEWKSMCDNDYLMLNRNIYFPFPDETPMNILLWKKNITQNFGRIYLNTLEFEPLKYIEENDNIVGDSANNGILGSELMRCDNSSNVMFYHGIKNNDELKKVIDYFNEKVNNN